MFVCSRSHPEDDHNVRPLLTEHDDGESFYYLRDDANYTAQGAILVRCILLYLV